MDLSIYKKYVQEMERAQNAAQDASFRYQSNVCLAQSEQS